jgi:glutamate dehydrogenase (NAD(P)+)
LAQGGISGRTESTGLGLFYVLNTLMNDQYFLKKAGLTPSLKDKKIVV